MQTVQRQFGKLMKRSADDSHIAILLKDFNNVDALLEKIIDSTRIWRDAWSALLTHQDRMFAEFEALYAPIIGASEDSSHTPVVTPAATLSRTTKLRAECEELKRDLLEELAAVDERMINPASQAKECLIPFKKTIKKRENQKLDYERYQNRVDNYSKKTKRSDRDNASLVKAEQDLSRAKEEYNAADEHLRQNLPPLITAVFSMLPRIMATQIEIQNNLLANYYTVIYNYCEEDADFTSTPPQIDQTVTQWEQAHLPIQQEVEGFSTIANGKAVRASQQQPSSQRSSSTLGARLTNGITQRRLSSNTSLPTQQRLGRTPSPSPGPSLTPAAPTPSYDTKPVPVYDTKPKPRLGDLPTPYASSSSSTTLAVPSGTYLTPQTSASSPNDRPSSPSPSAYLSTTPSSSGISNLGGRTDYFNRTHHPSPGPNSLSTSPSSSSMIRNSHSPGGGSSNSGTTSPGISAMLAGKKKPPPPPPPKPRGSSNIGVFVKALYDFGGQSTGDLVFREGDRIRVLKKTDSTDDWWEGELRGVKGSFPANYVELEG